MDKSEMDTSYAALSPKVYRNISNMVEEKFQSVLYLYRLRTVELNSIHQPNPPTHLHYFSTQVIFSDIFRFSCK